MGKDLTHYRARLLLKQEKREQLQGLQLQIKVTPPPESVKTASKAVLVGNRVRYTIVSVTQEIITSRAG